MSGFYGTPIIAPAAINIIQIENGDGSTLFGVVTGEETILTATADDIKIGKIAATDGGIVEGTDTKTYRVCVKNQIILPGNAYSIPLPHYDSYNYTQFNAMIAKFNTTINDSVAVEKIVLNDCIYNVNSTDVLAVIAKNKETKSIDFNIINDTTDIYVVYIATYKEEG